MSTAASEEGLIITAGGGWWSCPRCEHGNNTPPGYGWCFPAQCGGCQQWWAECPDEDCYGLGNDCPRCGGQTGGLIPQDPNTVVRLVCISVYEDNHFHLLRVPLLWERGGLVVHAAAKGDRGYTITHFRSGLAVMPGIPTRKDAIELAEQFLALGNWDREAHELKPGSILARRARKVRNAWRKAHP